MADLITQDLAALGDKSRIGLASIEATRAAITRKQSTPSESKMRLFKHPALAALLVILVIGVLAPVAYAIVDRLVLSVDVDQSETEIQEDIQGQLEAAGITGTVTATKNAAGDQIEIAIETDDKSLGSNLDVIVPNLPPNAEALQMRVEVSCELTDAQQDKLTKALTKADALADRPAGQTDAQLATAIKQALADAGFADADVTVTRSSVSVTIKSPPR